MHSDRAESSESEDSEWSQLEQPGSSHLDKLIKQRNRFNLHYHKSDIISIPQEHRIPLLPNEENFDWIEERKLMCIESTSSFRTAAYRRSHRPRPPRPSCDFLRDQFDADPLIAKLSQEWQGLSEAEKESARKKQSLLILSNLAASPDEEEEDLYKEMKKQELGSKRGRKKKVRSPPPYHMLDEEESIYDAVLSVAQFLQFSGNQEDCDPDLEQPAPTESKSNSRNN